MAPPSAADALPATCAFVILDGMIASCRQCAWRPWRILATATLAIFCLLSAPAAEPREETGFGSNPGNLKMFSYLPAGLGSQAPLVVVLHGCKQDAVGFARDAGWIALADRAGFALLLPEQKGLPGYMQAVPLFQWMVALWGANNQYACFNWFEPEDTARDRGEALSIREMIDAMIQRHGLNRSQVNIVGHSAGGAMANVLLAVYPERFAAGAIVAGIAYGCADTASRALQCMQPGIDLDPAAWRARVQAAGSAGRLPRISIWQGDADTVVAPVNARELVEQWTALHGIPATPTRREQQGSVTREINAGAGGTVLVESVRVGGLPHVFPIVAGGSCGSPSAFVKATDICATKAIARFWGLYSGD